MRKNAPVQSYGALKLAPFPGWNSHQSFEVDKYEKTWYH